MYYIYKVFINSPLLTSCFPLSNFSGLWLFADEWKQVANAQWTDGIAWQQGAYEWQTASDECQPDVYAGLPVASARQPDANAQRKAAYESPTDVNEEVTDASARQTDAIEAHPSAIVSAPPAIVTCADRQEIVKQDFYIVPPQINFSGFLPNQY